ncbi:hypothetical protein GWK47_033701 [Chionoecetes opilio]|uniref:Uncharacterized protein n=1 Tax=Chionoecetes opilio TaxID=41210 RepID=A0A8J4YRU6_CHIOP|nr:hypothetical protein GWK47_033701 [Chionoecetes opilio]
MACENMKESRKRRPKKWRDHLKRKLTGPKSSGHKGLGERIKTKKTGFSRDDSIPPLTAPDGSVSQVTGVKAQGLAAHFPSKMTVPDPERETPTVPVLTKAPREITITTEVVLQQLQQVDPKKALGPDSISPHLLKRGPSQLAVPLATIFRSAFHLSSGHLSGKWRESVLTTKKRAEAIFKLPTPFPSFPLLGKVS